MPRIAELRVIDGGKLAVILESPTSPEGSVTIWSADEVEAFRLSVIRECADIATSYSGGTGDLGDVMCETIAEAILAETFKPQPTEHQSGSAEPQD